MWFNILKVDIDFSDEPRGLGHFAGHTFDSSKDNIRINHKRIYNYLKGKLNREPTEKEIEEYIKRVIMHESTHAAHRSADDDFYSHSNPQREYLAYMGMFPENPYIALKEFLQHPDSMDLDNFDKLSWVLGFGSEIKYKEAPAKILRVLNYVDRWAKTGKQKNKLTKLELAARKQLQQWNKMKFPQNANQMLARYGNENKKFIYSLHQKPPGGK